MRRGLFLWAVLPHILNVWEDNMPVTTFVSLIAAVIAASGMTIWAVAQFGLIKVLPGLIVVALLARWGMAHVPVDDEPA